MSKRTESKSSMSTSTWRGRSATTLDDTDSVVVYRSCEGNCQHSGNKIHNLVRWNAVPGSLTPQRLPLDHGNPEITPSANKRSRPCLLLARTAGVASL